MKDLDPQLMWKYIEGQCSTEEVKQIEARLQFDPDFKAEWALRLKLHENLKNMELEEPSLRFSQNIMEQLPDKYQNKKISELFPPIWIPVYLSVFLFFSLIITFLPDNTGETIPHPVGDVAQEYNALVMNAIGQSSALFLLLVGAIGVSFLLFFFIDQQLQKRFQK